MGVVFEEIEDVSSNQNKSTNQIIIPFCTGVFIKSKNHLQLVAQWSGVFKNVVVREMKSLKTKIEVKKQRTNAAREALLKI